jgi:hypothetical protein
MTLIHRHQLLSGAFAGGLAFYLVYGPGHRTRTASTIGFALNMAGLCLFFVIDMRKLTVICF